MAHLKTNREQPIPRFKENSSLSLAEIERKYHNLFQNAQIAMYRLKIDGSVFLDANNKLAELFECSVDELLNKSALIKWANLDKLRAMVNLVNEKGVLTDYEIQIITKKGNVRICLASTSLYPEDGYLEGSILDITNWTNAKAALAKSEKKYDDSMETNRTNAEAARFQSDDNAKVALAKSEKKYDDSMETNRTNAEAAFAKSEKMFRSLIDFAYDWEYWIAPSGHFLYISPSCERITGYKPDEFINDHTLMARIIHPDSSLVYKKHIEEYHIDNKSQDAQELEFKITDKNGK